MTRLAWLLVPALIFACASITPTPTLTPEQDAWYACISFVQTDYGLPPSDAQSYESSIPIGGGGVVDMTQGTFWVRVFYAKYGQMYECHLVLLPDGNARLTSLELVP